MYDDENEPDENGIAPVSEDGAGVPEEAPASNLRTMPPQSMGGSARSRGEDADGEEEPEAEGMLFPMGTLKGDPKKTLKNFVRAGVPVETKFKLSNAEVPGPEGGGLFDVETPIYAIVKMLPGAVIPKPTRPNQSDGDYKATGWKFVQEMRVLHVEQATEHQVNLILNDNAA